MIEFTCEGCGIHTTRIVADTPPASGLCLTCEFVCEHVPGPEGVALLDQLDPRWKKLASDTVAACP